MVNHVVSGCGVQFVLYFEKDLYQLLEIQIHLFLSNHPGTEKTNATLQQYLRCYVNYQQNNWPDILPLAVFGYTHSVHVSTGMYPFQIMY